MNFPSQLVEDAVNEVSKLPGIGKKSALRLVLHLLKQDVETTKALSTSLMSLRNNIKYCKQCNAIADHELCGICSSSRRDPSIVCIVEDTRDILAIENTHQYNGHYHVLGGIISPVDGIGPNDLFIQNLLTRLESNTIKEVIIALSPTMEGDTTAFYLSRKLQHFPIRVSTIARGIPIGGELEYADEITLGRSILTRTDIQVMP